jgi:RNA polymerase sigma-70 factor, ECF subfamily
VTTTTTALERARDGDGEAFRELTEPYRRELHLHCYRILGSVQDAEDVLQETLLAAWRGLGQFEERASLRAWLYRIATNRSLNVLRASQPRTVQPPGPGWPEPTGRGEPVWLEPYPDPWLEGRPDTSPGPEARYETREALSLAFVAGLQHLPPRQRAVLVLRDVLGFRAAETASLLDTSEAAVNSALQRGRAALAAHLPARGRESMPLPRSAEERALARRFAEAFERADVEQVVALLTQDARLTMPPQPHQYQGRAAIAAFFLARPWWGARASRLVPTRANGQPAFGYYLGDPGGPAVAAHGLIVLTLDDGAISAITRFGGPGLFALFGLPAVLPA